MKLNSNVSGMFVVIALVNSQTIIPEQTLQFSTKMYAQFRAGKLRSVPKKFQHLHARRMQKVYAKLLKA